MAVSQAVVAARASVSTWRPYAIFLAYPVAWLLGVTWAVWPIVALFLLPSLIRRRRIIVPRGFGLWLAFLGWTLVSATQIDEAHRFLVLGFHLSLYVAATIVFLYLLNAPRPTLPTEGAVGAMAVLWGLVAVGGVVGILLPDLALPAPGAGLVPEAWSDIGYVSRLTSLRFSEASDFLGYTIPRPSTFFLEATDWADNFAMLTPVALLASQTVRTGLARTTLRVLLAVSVLPFVFSLARGAWVALAVALTFGAVALAIRGGRRARPVLAGLAVLAVVVMISPLGGIVLDRAETGHSNEHRFFLAREAVETTLGESPVFGFGTPRKISADRSALGSHGQVYYLLFSFGIPGLVFFLGWFAYAFWRLQRSRSRVTFWLSLVILAAIVITPFHSLEPNEVPLLMAAMGLAWREAGHLPNGSRRRPARPEEPIVPRWDGQRARKENRSHSDAKSSRASGERRSSVTTLSKPVE